MCVCERMYIYTCKCKCVYNLCIHIDLFGTVYIIIDVRIQLYMLYYENRKYACMYVFSK